ncbi:MAG TPA: hypothetical protein PK864_01050 [Syntrophorhabdaceae bacterium]|nr:hypothetical protein [Syntrophorhabdaceae bacterium]HOL05083.1 hypothetical protein [Syntrophorhabdaceae bacterium]HON84599.1 hypothetical protein [Syntrophorhabdaceae bacterium]HOT41102.1 hypothetical protein [Syntrophorhabdaceae bacterium]HPC66195.1 hypothetical protein [Syntrophorhabdaceae bacterium]
MAEPAENKRYCINCDNKHGCKSGTPPCVAEMKKDKITGITGKQYLIDKNKLPRCLDCSFFSSCWNIEDYKKLTNQGL